MADIDLDIIFAQIIRYFVPTILDGTPDGHLAALKSYIAKLEAVAETARPLAVSDDIDTGRGAKNLIDERLALGKALEALDETEDTP